MTHVGQFAIIQLTSNAFNWGQNASNPGNRGYCCCAEFAISFSTVALASANTFWPTHGGMAKLCWL